MEASEVVATGMEALFKGITTGVTNILTLFGTVSTQIMSLELFQLVMAVIMLMFCIGLVFYLVRRVKRRG